MQVSFDRRWFLIGIISLTQLVCVMGVGSIALRGIESQIQGRGQARALQENAQMASYVCQQIYRGKLKDFQPHSSDWNDLQNIVEGIRLPNDGYITVSRTSDGCLINHPRIRENAEYFARSVGKTVLDFDHSRCRIMDVVDQAVGITEFNGTRSLLAVQRLHELGLVVQAHQDADLLDAEIRDQLSPFRTFGLAGALALTFLTAVACVVIVRRYDNRLEAINRHLEHKVYDRSTALMKTRKTVIFGLAKLAESRDNDTGKHLERIRKYVTLLAQKLRTTHGLTNVFVDDLAFASSLHDIGKVGIPDAILLKRGALTPDERRTIEHHAAIGGQCLEAIQRQLGNDDFLELAKLIAFTHHERWDGKGYPFGLAKDTIPIGGRIVAVADVYDALTTKRPYKLAFPHEEAYQLIVSGSGTQFDPDVVAAFVHLADEFARIALEMADTHDSEPVSGSPTSVLSTVDTPPSNTFAAVS